MKKFRIKPDIAHDNDGGVKLIYYIQRKTFYGWRYAHSDNGHCEFSRDTKESAEALIEKLEQLELELGRKVSTSLDWAL